MSEFERGDLPVTEQSDGWTDTFINDIRTHMHGANLLALMTPKPEVAEMAAHFAGDHLPESALDVAAVAHIAELMYHPELGPNIRNSLSYAFNGQLKASHAYETLDDTPENQAMRYTFGLLSDFPEIADYARAHKEKCDSFGHEFADIEGLVGLVERTSFESIIIKSALDYSNLLLLESKRVMTPKEIAKMRRIITTIKTVDAPLLEIAGFEALAAVMLSKAYSWELEQANNGFFVEQAERVFDELGGRKELATIAASFLEKVFINDEYTHDPVTDEQERYEMFFTDGAVRFSDFDEEFRVIARLKSTGAAAKKMHNLYNKTEIRETPMDIIGTTIVATNKQTMAVGLDLLMKRLAFADVTYQSAPSRSEQVHVKGRPDFMAMFGTIGEYSDLYRNLSVQDEPCDNGYEAVKLTMALNHGRHKIPIEIQITHETARSQSRVGEGSHTIFKLMKHSREAGTATVGDLSTEEILERLHRIHVRKQKFDKTTFETNGDSSSRGDRLLQRLQGTKTRLGGIAIQPTFVV